MTDKTTVDIGFIVMIITAVVAVLGVILTFKNNRKQNEESAKKNEEHIEKKIKEANKESDEKTELKIKIEGLEREKLAGAMENIRIDYQLDNGRLRDLAKDVSKNKGDIFVLKEFKDHHEKNTTKIFEKLDLLTDGMNEIKVEIAKK
ncbi:MAG: hypothetical protein DRH97_00100 [Chloroflexi bacterium]|nr:MAG: hypothetical protein DRH97_00100 [Chloroflexota bacterium]